MRKMNGSVGAPDCSNVRSLTIAKTVGTRDESTPSFELPAPTESHAGRAMRSRIAGRLFDEPGPSQRVAHYEILRRVGAGGMGVVYAARDTKLDRVVALKLVRQRAMSERARERLVQEAQTLAKLSHPNVVQVYEVGEYEAAVYIAMEFVEGQTLGEWLRRRGPSTSELLAHFRAAGRGLAAAHAAGIVHRDFKPGNVLVGDDGRVRVADFGIAQRLDDAEGERALKLVAGESNKVAGTPGYIDPRLLTGEAADAHSDQYGFCVALWEAVSGERPYPTATIVEALEGGEPPAPRGQLRPRWLRRVLARGLAFEADARWPDMAALLEELHKRPRRRRRLQVGVALSLAAAVAVPLLQPMLTATPSCELERGGFDELWSAEQREQLLARAHNLDLAFAETALASVADELDELGARWRAVERGACEAHHQRGTLSAAGLDRSNACLTRELARARPLVARLSEGTRESALRADELLARLPDPERCRAVPAGLAPRSELLDPRHTLLERRLAELDARLAAGELGPKLDELEAMVEAARAHGEPTLQADAAVMLARARRGLGQPKAALEAVRQANQYAMLAEDDRRLLEAMHLRAELLASELDRPLAAREALVGGEALVERLDAPRLRADQALAQVLIAEAEGDYARAEELSRRALDSLHAAEAGERKLDVARMRLANALGEQGRHDEALELYEHVQANMRARLGDRHPRLAGVALNMGMTLYRADRLPAAQKALESAVELSDPTRGGNPRVRAKAQTMLAYVDNDMGDYERAEQLAEDAWEFQRKTLSSEHLDFGSVLPALFWARLSQEDFAGALEATEATLELPLADAERAETHQTAAWLLCRLGRYDGARAHAREAMLSRDPRVSFAAQLIFVEADLFAEDLNAALQRLAAIEGQVSALGLDLGPEFEAERVWLATLLSRSLGSDAMPPELTHILNANTDFRQHLTPDQKARLTQDSP